jgi:cobalt-zinc-cadmium efflux system protein
MHQHAHHHDHGSHGHDDHHDHHAHADGGTLAAFRWSLILNVALVAAEAAVGFAIGSMALLGDAGHNLTDVLGLFLAWAAARLALRQPTRKHTYGMARSTILAALLNATLLLAACGVLIWESVQRLREPHPVEGLWIMAVAGFAFMVNAFSAALFLRARRGDVNARGAFLHMAADAGVSFVVVVAGAAVLLTGWHWIDPIAGLAVAVAILWSGWGLLRESLDLALDAVPRGIDLARIDAALRGLPGVRDVHDLHVWPLSTTVAALTAHVVHDGTRGSDDLLALAQRAVLCASGIAHTTLQFEILGCGQDCGPDSATPSPVVAQRNHQPER